MTIKKTKQNEVKKLPAIPPNDYIGTMADWIIALNERGYNGNEYCDILISEEEYSEILEQCEE